MISLIRVSYTYPKGGFTLVCPRADFPEGEVTLLVGGNGSGKTTLARLLSGVLRPDKGQYLIQGERAEHWSLGRIGAKVGYLLQEPSRQLFRPLVWQEMTFASDLLGREQGQTAERAESLLAEFDLLRLKDRPTLSLSRGEKQRLALAALLMGGAGFFILDEPTTGLDRHNRLILYDKIEQLRGQGVGFAIASHDRELTGRWPRRVLLEQGRVLHED